MHRASLVLAAVLTAFAAFACRDDDEGTRPSPATDATTGAGQATAPPGMSPTTEAEPSPAALPAELVFERVTAGFERPTFVTGAGDGSGRLFVVEKAGRIRIVEGGRLLPEPFLDIDDRVKSSGNEQGLLGLAFHPDFERNGRFFVAYTANDDANTLAEFRAAPGADRADAASERVLLAIDDFASNHNGGMVAFGRDGYLYFGTGDGGGGGDPQRNGQNLGALLGKILRLDVDGGETPYGIPRDNPFAALEGARPEVWAYGLRNPWRWSFDRDTGDLWIADVGQNAFEELNFQPASSDGGENYGWNVMEGSSCFRASSCDRDGLVLPVFAYGRDDGCSVTGGYVYRGRSEAALRGVYVFTDYCSGNLWLTRRLADGRFETAQHGSAPEGISSFGEDDAGELYAVADRGGALYRVRAGE